VKIAVIGAGAVGSLFSARLTEAGRNVVLIDKYPDRAKHLTQTGLSLTGVSGDRIVPVPATVDSDSVGTADLVLICVKAYDTKSAIEQHASLVGPNTSVLTLQNGLGNVDVLIEAVGVEKVLGGTTAQGGFMTGLGKFHHAGAGPTFIGEISGQSTDRVQMLAEMLNDAGIKTEISSDVNKLIWTKLVVNVGINALTALLQVTNGVTSSNEYARAVQRAAVDEAVTVGNSAGVDLDRDHLHKHVVAVAEATAPNINSMLADRRKKARTEIDYINGAIVRKGDELGIEVPVNRTLAHLMTAIETSYELQVE
jgi:2-dehydropantoate 2-reductase